MIRGKAVVPAPAGTSNLHTAGFSLGRVDKLNIGVSRPPYSSFPRRREPRRLESIRRGGLLSQKGWANLSTLLNRQPHPLYHKQNAIALTVTVQSWCIARPGKVSYRRRPESRMVIAEYKPGVARIPGYRRKPV